MSDGLPGTCVIVLDSVTKTFRAEAENVVAIRQAGLRVKRGELVALMGASGSGKSTLLAVIAGLVIPDEGSVLVNGHDVVALDAGGRSALRLREVAVVFQDDNLIEEFTALENVALPLDAAGVSWGDANRQARAALERVGIAELADRRPHQMSGGQRQRTGIARALVGNRSVLLADEPTGSLDAENTHVLVQLIKGLCLEGLTAVIATHDPIVADAADRVVSMSSGEVIAVRSS